MRTIIRTGLLAFTLVFAACGGSAEDQHGDAKLQKETQDVNKQNVDEAKQLNENNDSLKSRCTDFVVQAAHDGMMEVEMGNLAYQNAATQPVKVFAKSLLQDHSKANTELKELATKKSIVVPTEIDHKDHDKLKGMKGEDFDQAYMDMLVAHHKKAVELFEDASEKCDDADIRNYASQKLPVLQQHLKTAETINEALKKKDKGGYTRETEPQGKN